MKKTLPLFLSGVLLAGLVVSLATIQSVAAEQQMITSQANPLSLIQAAKLTASDGAANDVFGWAVAVSSDTIVVGAYGDDNKGSAYVFVKPSGGWSGTLTETAKLVASDGAASDLFGYAVGISDDTVVVGTPGKGSTYIFVKPGSGWSGLLTQTAKLVASDGAANDFFGTSVALSNDTVIVGADGDNFVGNADRGSAYVFVKPGGGWSGILTQTTKLVASDGAANDFFGTSARISHDTIVVGTRGDDSFKGSAYVFIKPSGGWGSTLTETAKLIASDGGAGNYFGASVGVSGDTVVSGAIFHTIGLNTLQGAAYTFVKPGSGWSGTLTETAKLIASDGAGGDRLGVAVAISSDTIVANAEKDDNKGSAYVFVKPINSWSGTLTETTKLTATDGITGELFESVAIDNETIVAGVINSGNSFKGLAYVFVPGTPDSIYLPVVLK
jgi:hypothetical protein